MHKIGMLLIIFSSINLLAGCGKIYCNVVPQVGPSMEEVYDGMTMPPNNPAYLITQKESVSITANTSENKFKKAVNPELSMYVFPHFATRDQIPIPGYDTVFNAYQQDHYVLTRG